MESKERIRLTLEVTNNVITNQRTVAMETQNPAARRAALIRVLEQACKMPPPSPRVRR